MPTFQREEIEITILVKLYLHEFLFLPVLLERSHEGSLVLRSLEPSMTKLGAGVDKLQVDLLQSSLLGVGKERLPERENPLLRSNTTSLKT